MHEKILRTSATWSMNRSSQQPSNPMTQHIILKIPKLYSIWYALDFNTEGILLDCLELLYYTKAPRPVSFCYLWSGQVVICARLINLFWSSSRKCVHNSFLTSDPQTHNKYKEGEGGKDVVLSMNSNYYFLILYPKSRSHFSFLFWW